jgi:hypothetical protein
MVTASTAGARRIASILLIAEPLLFFAAFAVLGAAINWPASLGLPFDQALPLIAANLFNVRTGYGLYLTSSLLTAPLAVALLFAMGRDKIGLAFGLSALFMVMAALFKAMGITRWMIAMPALAEMLAGANGDAATIAAVRATFVGLNEYAGGGLGEWMGVGLMTGLWMACLAVAVWPAHKLIAALMAFAAVAALLIVPNEFSQTVPTFILQASARTASMIAQFMLAWHVLHNAA